MRGADDDTSQLFSYLSPESRVRPDHPLRAIRQLTDAAFAELSPQFDRLYSAIGRPSIPPEQLLRALLVQTLYTIRGERLLMEEIDYSILCRWFVGLGLDEPIWSPSTFSKNRDRLLEGDVAAAFFDACGIAPPRPACSSTSTSRSTARSSRRGPASRGSRDETRGGVSRRTTPAIRMWTSAATSARMRRTRRRPTPMRSSIRSRMVR